jgi:hypothetical protein
MHAEPAGVQANDRRELAMTGNVSGDRQPGDAEWDVPGDQPGQDMHPAIDPREEVDATSDHTTTAPPLDVDEREGGSHASGPTDPIEMPATHDELPGDVQDVDTGFTPVDLDAESDATIDPSDEPAGNVDSTSSDLPPTTESVTGAPEPETQSGSSPNGSNLIAEAAASVGGAFSKLNVGRFFASKDTTNGAAGQPYTEDRDPDAPLPPPRRIDGFRGFLDPRLHMPDLIPHRRFTTAAVLISLLMLMANNAGLALITIGVVIPVLIVMTLTQHDVFEKESNLIVAALAVAGGVAGLLIGWISAWVVNNQWFDTGRLNFGASGFGGRFAEAEGSAPVIVWMVAGLLLPAAAIVGIGAVPVVLRRWPQFRNEVMDGMIMAGASAAGLSIGLSIVTWLPMVDGDGPQTSVSDWTLMIVGISIVRPIVFTLCGAMIGAGVWRYMMRTSSSLTIYPAVAGVVGIFLLVIGSLQLQSNGIWSEFLWTVLVAIATFVLYRRVLDQAVATDFEALGDQEQRMVCPHCHQVTPVGAYCARCGKPLADSPTPVTQEDPAI